MRIVTSYGPSRIERQQKCLRSWINAGYEVTAVQSIGEAETLSKSFPQATFVETDLVGDLFGKPSFVRVKALLDQAKTENVLITNSDIELTGDVALFQTDWLEPDARILKVGVRWDSNPRVRGSRIFKWGLDAFLITPQIAADLPDVGLAIGCPAWDYWIPYHLHMIGYSIVTNSRHNLSHEVHSRAWSDQDYATGLQIMETRYSIGRQQLADFIQEKTGQRHLKHWRHAR